MASTESQNAPTHSQAEITSGSTCGALTRLRDTCLRPCPVPGRTRAERVGEKSWLQSVPSADHAHVLPSLLSS